MIFSPGPANKTLCSLVALIFLGSATRLPAQNATGSQDLSDSQIQAIQKQLKTLRENQTQGSFSHYKGAMQAIKTAKESSGGARDLYEKCYRELNFAEGLVTREKDYKDWVNENDHALGFDPFLTAVRIQLEYLMLSIRACQAEKISVVLPDLSTFMRSIVAIKEPIHPYLDENVNGSIFARALQLRQALTSEGWEFNPLEIGEMYEKTILPYLRLENPSGVVGAWTERIQQETAMAQKYLDLWKKMEPYYERNQDSSRKASNKDKVDHPSLIAELNKLPSLKQEYTRMAKFAYDKAKEADRFFREKSPELRWNMLQDSYQYGPHSERAKTAKAMLDYIEKNLAHPSAASWMTQLEALTSNKEAAPTTPAASTAPATKTSSP